MASTRVKQHIGAALRKPSAGPVSDPRIAANLETNPHSAAIEQQIANRIIVSRDFYAADDARRPATKPAWLVVNAVAGQMLLRHQAQEPPVAGDGHRVVDGAL